MSDGLRAGQVAAAVGVNVQTLRYYERRGLLAEPARTNGGHRLYPAEAITVLRVIKAAQNLGFTLEEIADLLDTTHHRHNNRNNRPDPGLQARAAAKITEIEAKINNLVIIRESLQQAVAAGCDDLTTCAASTCCPIPFADLVRSRAPTDGDH